MTSDQYYPLDLNEEDYQHHDQVLFDALGSHASSSSHSSSSLSCPSFFNPPQEQERCYHGDHSQQSLQHQEEDKAPLSSNESCVNTTQKEAALKLTIRMKEDRHENPNRSGESNSSPMKWMSSKMRLMKKMMKNSDRKCGSDQTQVASSHVAHTGHRQGGSIVGSDNKGNNSNAIRVCADCNTTKTPLWRSGPRGPKSLCNACGIRQRKARRAAMAAAAIASDPIFTPNDAPKKLQSKKKRPNNNNGTCVQQVKKKKSKVTSNPSSQVRKPSSNKLCFDDLTIILSKSSAFQQVFPQDEKEAAILLMALSYGMVHG